MVSKKFVIENEQGLHMRPAGVLAKAVTKFESDVTIVFEDKKINAKSLLNIIGACIKCGSEIELVCEGYRRWFSKEDLCLYFMFKIWKG